MKAVLFNGPWWRLTLRWFLTLKNRSAESKKGLFRNSFKVAILGLAMGVAALSIVRAIIQGFENQLATGVSKSLGELVYFSNWKKFSELDKLVSGPLNNSVQRKEYFWTTQGLLVGPKGGRGVMIEGRECPEKSAVGDEVSVSLGKPLAEYLGVQVGDTVKILLPGILSSQVQARVIELLDHGMYAVDSRLAIIDDRSLRPMMAARDPDLYSKRPGDAHGVRFFMKPEFTGSAGEKNLLTFKKEFASQLVSRGEKEPLLRTWREQRRNIFGAVDHEKGVLSLVFSLLTLVASLNVAACLVVLYLERDRELALLQALGLSRFSFLQWLLMQGLVLGFLSSLLGLFLGRVLGWILQQLPIARLPSDIYNISELPLAFVFQDQICIFAFGMFSALIVAFVLGWKLSRMSLIQVLGQRR